MQKWESILVGAKVKHSDFTGAFFDTCFTVSKKKKHLSLLLDDDMKHDE